MQTYCVNCKKEQYAPAVHAISHGEAKCPWCGYTSSIYTDEEKYRADLAASLINNIPKTIC